MNAFRHLAQERLQWVCDRATRLHLVAGDVLVREGDPPEDFFLQVQGQITVSGLSNGGYAHWPP